MNRERIPAGVGGVTASAIDVALRRCGPEDAASLSTISAATFLESYAEVVDGQDLLAFFDANYSVRRYAEALADPASALWLAVALPGGSPVGYAMLTRPHLPTVAVREDDLELKRIYVLHRFQGGGHGAALMREVLNEARARGAGRLLLGAHKDNARALDLYERLGFRRIGEWVLRVGATDHEDLILALDMRGKEMGMEAA